MKKIFLALLSPLLFSTFVSAQSPKTFTGSLSNGMKGDKISFILAADGKTVEEVTFSGYWRCGGKLEQITVGPDKGFAVKGNTISGVVVEPPAGGATAWRFELHGEIKGKTASGTFRMNINALKCDTYLLKWTAATK